MKGPLIDKEITARRPSSNVQLLGHSATNIPRIFGLRLSMNDTSHHEICQLQSIHSHHYVAMRTRVL